jgi:uncharacterized membrane protein
MPLALALFPDVDRLEDLIEASTPWFGLWLIALAVVLIVLVIGQGVSRLRHRLPVDRLLRRRFG